MPKPEDTYSDLATPAARADARMNLATRLGVTLALPNGPLRRREGINLVKDADRLIEVCRKFDDKIVLEEVAALKLQIGTDIFGLDEAALVALGVVVKQPQPSPSTTPFDAQVALKQIYHLWKNDRIVGAETNLDEIMKQVERLVVHEQKARELFEMYAPPALGDWVDQEESVRTAWLDLVVKIDELVAPNTTNDFDFDG